MGRLFWKFILIIWLALVLIAAGAGALVWIHQQGSQPTPGEHNAPPRGNPSLDAAALTLSHGGEAALRALLGKMTAPPHHPILVLGPDGEELLGRPLPPTAADRLRRLQPDGPPGHDARAVTLADGRRFLLMDAHERRAGPAGPPGGRGKPPHPPDAPPPRWLLLAISLGASLAAAGALAWYMARPIRHLRSAFEAVAAGRLDTRVGPRMGRRRDEIADLGRDFDHMTRQLQTLMQTQQQLLHDVSHELRSPLARLQAAIGLARQNPQRLLPTLERIEREVGRLDELVGEILTLARMQAGAKQQQDRLDLMQMVASIAEDARFEARAAGKDVAIRCEGEAMAQVYAEPLYRACENIIRNAVKYTAAGTQVDVFAHGDASQRFTLQVADRGPGLKAVDPERMFDPFYRGENGQGTGGFGLGLTIARRAAELHGGTLSARARPGGGLEMVLVLPLHAG